MIKEGKFGPSEAIVLLSTSMCIKVFLASPAQLSELTGTSAWYATIISGLTAMIGFTFIYRLLKRFPGYDLVDIYKVSFGKVLGFILAFAFAIYTFFVAETNLCEFYQIMRVYFFPLSPNWYLSGLFVISICIICILGLESLARIAKLVVFILIGGVILILIMSYKNYDINNIFPILGHGLDKTLLYGVLRSSVYGEVILLAVFANSFQGIKFIKREGYVSITISTLIVSLIILVLTLTYPYYRLKEMVAPMYELTTIIRFGRFLTRVESVFLIIWIVGTLISVSLIFYAFISMYCKLFNINDKKPVVFAGCLILFILSITQKDIVSVIKKNLSLTRNYGSILLFILPLAALIIAAIRKKGGRQDVREKDKA